MIVGIDLGTTHSLACIWNEDEPLLIPNSFGEVLTPSVVGLDDDGRIIVGQLAKERLLTHPHLTVAYFKQYMGTNQRLALGDKLYTAEELSSFVIRKLIEDAKLYLNQPVDEVIVSVPAYFADSARGATKNAAHLAGIKVERIINEPSAAALAYHYKEGGEATYVVIDLGGGTLDLSVVDAFDNVIEILSVSGDNHLGGEDFTEVILQNMLMQGQVTWESLSGRDRAYLHNEAEKVKLALNLVSEVNISITLEKVIFDYHLSFTDFFELTKNLLQRVQKCVYKVMHDCSHQMMGLDSVILVGGGSKLRVFKEYIEYLFEGREILFNEPDTCIALGCGMVAGIKERKEGIKDLLLADICPFSLGIDLHNGQFSPIIERNSPLPFSKEQRYQTTELGQSQIIINVYQGEHYMAKDNILLESFQVDVPINRHTHEEILVRFTYDINGILEVDVKILSTNENVSKRIISKAYAMSVEELDERIEFLQKLKLHPRDNEKNEYLLARAYRLFEEIIGQERAVLGQLIEEFKRSLESQNPKDIQIDYRRLSHFIGER